MKGIDRNGIGVALFAFFLGIIGVKALDVGLEAEQKADAAQPPVTVHETRNGGQSAETVLIQFQATRHRNCRLSATSEWERPDGIRLSRTNPNKATLRPGQTRWIELEIAVPENLAPGAYRVRSVGEYDCNGRVFIVPTGWIEVTL